MKKRDKRIHTEQGAKRLRVSSTYTEMPDIYEKLDRLATACGIRPTTLQTELVKLCLQNENIINYIQDRYRHCSRFRIIPSKLDGDLKYIFAEKKKAVK
ncbi:hypothetical protein [Ammoniphilus sp. 3BR4]|uniref:hypothetical protein n=1 Tax=Ammoniphilus sp. 3BR4 TaxID=3158265 RepID=UPI003465923F